MNIYSNIKHRLLFFLLTLLFLPFTIIHPADELLTEQWLSAPTLPLDSVATSDDINALYFNPAGLSMHPVQVGYYYSHNDKQSIQNHTAFLNLLGLAFSADWRYGDESASANRYTIGTSLLSNRALSVGTSYSWFSSSDNALDRYARWDLGLLLRPMRFFSIGAVARGMNNGDHDSRPWQPYYDVGLAIRPYLPAPEKLTLSIDASWHKRDSFQDLLPRYMAEFTPYPSLSVYAGIDTYSNISFGMRFSYDRSQLVLQGNSMQDQGDFFSGGFIIGQERHRTEFSVLPRWLEIPLDIDFAEIKEEGFLFLPDNITFYEILKTVEVASKDSEIEGILLTGQNFKGGWAQAEELREALLRFKSESGKEVHAWLESASNKEYYIATAADSITMPKAASLELSGIKIEAIHLKDLLTKVGIEADFITAGKYKSAPEMFTESSITEADYEQLNALMQRLATELKRAVTRGRNLSNEEADTLMNQGLFTSDNAKSRRLIDEVGYFSDFEQYITGEDDPSDFRLTLNSYKETRFYNDHWGPRKALAVVVMEGEITSGESDSGGLLSSSAVGSDTYVRILKKIRKNPRIKAVVIRINSPGGSGLASDLIWRELQLLKEEKEAVIVSLGNVAASGGYYIAVGADEIVADTSTITGSVGVFAGKFSLKGLYQWLGVNKTLLTSHDKAALFTETDVFTPAEREMMQKNIDDFYDLFLERVQSGRKMTGQKAKQNAGGRVYTGSEAKEREMVDHLGGLMLAIELARQKADLNETYTDTILYPSESKDLIGLNTSPRLALPQTVRLLLNLYTDSKEGKQERIYFMMPYEIKTE